MKRLVINANGNAITSSARELKPTGVGEYIYIYIYIYTVTRHLYCLNDLASLENQYLRSRRLICPKNCHTSDKEGSLWNTATSA